VDDDRFESVWSKHGPAVLRYCTYSTGSPQEGEDIAADTFIRFLAKGDRVAPEHTEAWLIRVARNLCATHHRTAKRRRRLESHLAQGLTAEIAGWSRPDVWEYARRLKEADRLAIYLRVAEDRSFADMARLLRRTEGSAKMTFYRAIDRLRREIERDGAGQYATPTGGADLV
jgi:RNA polymerase sigma factor (sigma-70 family)